MSPTEAQVALHDPNALLHARITAGVAGSTARWNVTSVES